MAENENDKSAAGFEYPKCGSDTLRFAIVRTGVYCANPPAGIGVITEFADDTPSDVYPLMCNSCETVMDSIPERISAEIQSHYAAETGLSG